MRSNVLGSGAAAYSCLANHQDMIAQLVQSLGMFRMSAVVVGIAVQI